MVKEVDTAEWQEAVKNTHSVFFNPDFLNTIASSFKYKLHYIIYTEKGRVQAAFALFSKGKNIVTPIAFTYASIYWNKELSDRKYIAVFKSIIEYLKKKWVKISLRLSSEFTDLRPFTWNGFEIENRYTYIKDPDSGLHKSIRKNFEKAEISGCRFDVHAPDAQSIEKNLDFFKKQGITEETAVSYKKLFQSLSDRGDMLSFNVYEADKLICSNIFLIDKERQKVFTLLLYKTENKLAHTFLYKKRIEWCKANNVIEMDLCGANEEGIAEFKSYFNPRLEPYYLVHYNPYDHLMKDIYIKVKVFFKRIVRR